jgi:uncharacterized Zn finger protein (UPF0148 family)
MATTSCPVCGLTVPYFCCEGLVCPACGYDEEQSILSRHDKAEGKAPKTSTGQPLPTDSDAPRSPVQQIVARVEVNFPYRRQ